MPVTTLPDSLAGRAYGGRSVQDRVAARRARFIAAGIDLFGSQGFRAATVRGVCAVAGLTDRYFYESFDSLEALLHAVYRALMQRLGDGLPGPAAAPARRGPAAMREGLRAAYAHWFSQVRDPHFARIVLNEVLGVSPATDALYEAGMRDFSVLNTRLLDDALARAGASAVQRELLGQALAGAAVQLARSWWLQGYRVPQDAVVDSAVRLTMGAVRALRAPG